MKWNPFVYNECEYDLSHVHPFNWTVELPINQDGAMRTYKFHVEFSDHVFTTKKELGDASLKYEPGSGRYFDFIRYELSKELPNIIKTLGTRQCFHTSHHNFLTIEKKDDSGESRNYVIYFAVSKSPNKGWLRLYIESAYILDPERDAREIRKRKIGFYVIARNVLAKKRIISPK